MLTTKLTLLFCFMEDSRNSRGVPTEPWNSVRLLIPGVSCIWRLFLVAFVVFRYGYTTFTEHCREKIALERFMAFFKKSEKFYGTFQEI